jgi:hypothetical protein
VKHAGLIVEEAVSAPVTVTFGALPLAAPGGYARCLGGVTFGVKVRGWSSNSVAVISKNRIDTDVGEPRDWNSRTGLKPESADDVVPTHPDLTAVGWSRHEYRRHIERRDPGSIAWYHDVLMAKTVADRELAIAGGVVLDINVGTFPAKSIGLRVSKTLAACPLAPYTVRPVAVACTGVTSTVRDPAVPAKLEFTGNRISTLLPTKDRRQEIPSEI